MWKKPSKTKEPENMEKAYEYAVFLLSLKLRTVGEVLSKMQQRGYSEWVIGETLDRLKRQNYLDDYRYAEIFLENLKAYRNFGYYGIKKKFLEKKIPVQLIDRVLADGLSVKDEEKIARRLLKKEGFEAKTLSAAAEQSDDLSYRSFGDEKQNKEKAKMANRLKSRGFRTEVISRLLF